MDSHESSSSEKSLVVDLLATSTTTPLTGLTDDSSHVIETPPASTSSLISDHTHASRSQPHRKPKTRKKTSAVASVSFSDPDVPSNTRDKPARDSYSTTKVSTRAPKKKSEYPKNARHSVSDEESSFLVEMTPMNKKSNIDAELESHKEVHTSDNRTRCNNPLYLAFAAYWLNFLLLIIPFPVVIYFADWNKGALFICSLISIFPLSSLLKIAQCSLAKHAPTWISSVVCIISRNMLPLLIGIFAVHYNLIRLAQGIIMGAILHRLLLMFGLSLTVAAKSSYAKVEEHNIRISSSMLYLAIGIIIMPTFLSISSPDAGTTGLLTLSRWCAILLLLLLVFLFIFTIKTHPKFWEVLNLPASAVVGWIGAIFLLIIASLLSLMIAFFIGKSASWLSLNWGISYSFIGGIMIPIGFNAADTIDAVRLSFRGNFKAITSDSLKACLEMCMYVGPLLVIGGWFASKQMGFHFFGVIAISGIFAIVSMALLLSAHKANWLQGSLIMVIYLMFAVSYFLQNEYSS